MSELVNLVQARWLYALALVVGFPALVVALNELSFALARAGRPVAASVRFVRTWVVPLVAFSLFLRLILRLPATSLWVRLTDTVFWALTIVAIIGVVNNVVFESARPGSWQRKVPALLRDLIRLLLVAIGLAVVYSFVWGREIEGALAALGVTSIVVGLALQEPLGNLFSGLMLLMERPFEVGETIEVGSVSGKVIEVNWRSAHIEAIGGSVMVVPNSTLNKETIVNFSRPRPNRTEMIDINFSHEDPPYQVRQALAELARDTEGVLGAPIAATLSYGDFGIKYRLIYRTREEDRWPVRNELVTRIWYMAKRHGFTLPYPVQVSLLHQQTHPFKEAEPAPAELLGQFPRLPKIAADDHAGTRRLTFGKGERLFDEGDALDGVLFVVSGSVSLQVVAGSTASEIGRVGAGEFCGNAGMHGHQPADMRAVALEDTEVVLIAPDAVRHLFEASPRLARDTGYALEVHRKAVQSARSAARQG